MKTQKIAYSHSSLAALAVGILTLTANLVSAVTETFTSSGSFTPPAGVTSIKVECWGGGGAGGGARNTGASGNVGGGGGAGGTYARKINVPVSFPNTYTVTIPAAAAGVLGTAADGTRNNGSAVTFTGDGGETVTAAGGQGGANKVAAATVNGGLGGTGSTTGCVGDVGGIFAGGSGAGNLSNGGAGGGGGGAGDANAGGSATTNSGAAGGATGGGSGGSGPTGSNNGNTVAPSGAGGGGSGGRIQGTGNRNGGAGAKGQIIITYTVSPNFKANNAISLNDPASWTAFVPTGSIAEWNNLVTAANTTSLGGNLTFSGVRISDPGGLVTIDTGNTLTLGAAPVDLDLSTATQDLTLSCNLALGAANVWDVASGRTLTLGGAVSGAFAVTKQGSGTAILSGTNTWTGTTTVSAGTLKLAAPAVIPDGTGNGNVALTGTLDLNGNNEAINGLSGAGVVDNTAASSASILTVGSNNQTSSFSGALQNSGSSASLALTKTGTGALTLTGASTHIGLTTINSGGLNIQNASALGTTAAGTEVNGTATGGTGNARLDLQGGITVTGEAVTIKGVGNFTGALSSVSGSNEWTGNVTIGATSTRIGASAGATLKVSGVIDSGVASNGLLIRSTDLTGIVILSGANTYLGDTTNFIGKLQLDGGDNRLPVASKLITGSGALLSEFDLNGRNQELAGLAVTSGATAANNSINNSSVTLSTLTVNTASPSSFAGILKGNLTLTKTGVDTLTLAGANIHTGATNVNVGTLLFSTASSGVSDVSVSASASAGALVAATDGQFISTGDLALANNSVLTIDYGTTTPSTTVAPIRVDNFTVGTGLALLLDSDNLAGLTVSQAYPLVTWTTGPADGSAFTTVLNPRIQGTFSVTGTTLFFTVTTNTSGSPISWNTANGTWDTATSNWVDANLTTTTFFNTFDAVRFGDAAGATGNPAITLNSAFSPAGVTMNSTAHDYTISGTGSIGGNTSLSLDAANTRTLSLATANTYTGATAINGGTLRLGNGGTDGSIAATGAISIGTGATFAVNQSDTVTQGTEFSTAAISGAGGLAQTGSGTTILNAVNTYTGPSTISGGTLQIGAAGQLGGGTYAGDIAISGGAAFQYASSAAQTLSGIISGNGTLTKSGVSTLTLAGANSYSGATTISVGVLSLGHVDALQNTSGITIAGGATLVTTTDAITIGAPITTGLTSTTSTISFGRATAAAGSLTLNGAISGGGNVSFTTPDVGSGGNIQTILIGAAGTYAGSTSISTPNPANSVTVKAGITNALPTATVLTLNGGNGSGSGRTVTYDLGGFDQTLAGLTNNISTLTARNQRVTNSGTLATLTINNSTAYTYGGTGISSTFNSNPVNPTAQITGAIALTKDGAGTFTLAAGAGNTFTGATKITEGILSLSHATSLLNSPLDTLNSVAGDATNGLQTTVTALTLGGLTGNKTLASVFETTAGGYSGLTALTLNPGTGATPSYSGVIANGAAGMTLTKTGAGIQTLSGANTYTGATTVSAGTLALVGGSQTSPITVSSLASLGFTLGSGTTSDSAVTFDTGSAVTITGTPAPATSYTLLTTTATISGPLTLSPLIPGFELQVDGLNTLKLVPVVAGYASWIAGFFPGETDPAIIGANADPDNDSLDNGVEMVVGGNPATGMDTALLPTIELVNADPDNDLTFNDYLLFTYRRSDLSVAGGVTADCETDADLVAPWTAATGAPGVVILTDDNYTFTPPAAANTDRVRVYVPRGANTTLFGRLNVLVP